MISNILKINDRDIVIKLDNNKHWSDHIKHFNELKTLDLFFEKTIKDLPKTSKGKKCYLSYNNKIYAWVDIYMITKKPTKVVIKIVPHLNFIFPSILFVINFMGIIINNRPARIIISKHY